MKKIGKHRLYRGDCLKKLKLLGGESVHVCLSDPPYGIDYEEWDVTHKNTNTALGGSSKAQLNSKLFKRRGKPLNGWSNSDANNGLDYCNYCKPWLYEIFRVLKPGGFCMLFSSRRLLAHMQLSSEAVGFTTMDVIAWHKLSAPFRAQRVSEVFNRRGDKKSASKYSGLRLGNLAPMWEPILWLRKPYQVGGTLADNLLNCGTGCFNDVLPNHGNVIEVSARISKRRHPTQKPVALMEKLVLLATQPNQTVLDVFCGSGSTGVACVNTGRKFIGIEKDKTYFRSAVDRIRKARKIKRSNKLKPLTKRKKLKA